MTKSDIVDVRVARTARDPDLGDTLIGALSLGAFEKETHRATVTRSDGSVSTASGSSEADAIRRASR